MKKIIHVLAALLVTLAPAYAADEDSGIGNVAPTTPDKALLITMLPEKIMQASFIHVEHVNDGKVLLCFKDPDKQSIGCFVVNVNTGQVVFIPLKTDLVST